MDSSPCPGRCQVQGIRPLYDGKRPLYDNLCEIDNAKCCLIVTISHETDHESHFTNEEIKAWIPEATGVRENSSPSLGDFKEQTITTAVQL